jgi:predicted permease
VSAFLLLALCMGAGILIGRSGKAPPALASGITWFAINIALPALAMHLGAGLRIEASLAFLVASQWIMFIGAWLLVAAVGRALDWSPLRTGALVIVAGLGNTAFMGYPLIEALRGRTALPYAVVVDQAGSFVVFATLGLVVTALYTGRKVDAWAVAKRALMFPGFIGFSLGVLAGLTVGLWEPLDLALERVGLTLTPLAVFAVGLQLQLTAIRGEWFALSVTLGWKLVAAPLVVLGVGLLFGVAAPVLDIAVLQSAMAPMISSVLLAEQEGLEGRLATAILGVGMIVSLATVPLAGVLLRSFLG